MLKSKIQLLYKKSYIEKQKHHYVRIHYLLGTGKKWRGKKKLEKTEGGIKNGQSTENCNIGYTRHNA